jgi:rare lipoprotein A (peptidoglycan hydrolase)
MFGGALGRAGVFGFVFACVVPFLVPNDMRSISVARAFATAAADIPGQAPERVRDVARAEVVLGVQSTPIATSEPAAPVVVATRPPLPDPPTGAIVIASWYGPGFYGNRTACGQIYTPEIIGVAHRTLRCGTMLVLEYRGRTMTVPVIDRGPYIAGRTLDLSNATRLAMACPDLCTLSMRIAP